MQPYWECGNRAITTASQDRNTPTAAVWKMRGLPDNCNLARSTARIYKRQPWKMRTRKEETAFIVYRNPCIFLRKIIPIVPYSVQKAKI